MKTNGEVTPTRQSSEDSYQIELQNFFGRSPFKTKELINQIGQKVEFYDLGEGGRIYAVIDGKRLYRTDFFDDDDFCENSDYNPVLINDEIDCAFYYYEKGTTKLSTEKRFKL